MSEKEKLEAFKRILEKQSANCSTLLQKVNLSLSASG